MPYASQDRRREANREWHRKQVDDRCEAIKKNGQRCNWNGSYDGMSQEVRCNLHAR